MKNGEQIAVGVRVLRFLLNNTQRCGPPGDIPPDVQAVVRDGGFHLFGVDVGGNGIAVRAMSGEALAISHRRGPEAFQRTVHQRRRRTS